MDEDAIVRHRPRIEACPTNPSEIINRRQIKRRGMRLGRSRKDLFNIEEDNVPTSSGELHMTDNDSM
jgi:hypothetical protein